MKAIILAAIFVLAAAQAEARIYGSKYGAHGCSRASCFSHHQTGSYPGYRRR